MKNYKMLVPIVLVGLTALSCYQLFSENLDSAKEYNDNLSNARYCASVGIVDAASYYEKALSINKNLDVYQELAEYYIKNNNYDGATSLANFIISDFPKSSYGYDLLMSIYDVTKNYNNLFSTYKKTQKKNIHSASIDEAYENNEYEYFESGRTYCDIKPEMNGYYVVQNENDNWGYANEGGGLQLGCSYKYAGAFSSALAPVKTEDNELYYIDNNGGKKYVFNSDVKFDYLGPIVNGLYVVGFDGNYDYYNTEFKKVFGDYQFAGTFNCGIAAVKKDNKWMLINTSGDVVSDTYDSLLINENDVVCVNNRVVAVKDKSYYILNEKGEVVKQTDFQDIAYVGEGNLIAYELNDKWGFCDLNGNGVINPQYDDAKSFSNGYAAVCKNNKWGYITEDEKLALDYEFDDAYYFNASGCTFVSRNSDKWSMIKLYKDNCG